MTRGLDLWPGRSAQRVTGIISSEPPGFFLSIPGSHASTACIGVRASIISPEVSPNQPTETKNSTSNFLHRSGTLDK